MYKMKRDDSYLLHGGIATPKDSTFQILIIQTFKHSHTGINGVLKKIKSVRKSCIDQIETSS